MVKFFTTLLLCTLCISVFAEDENDYYPLITIPTPKEVPFEVGGLELLPDGRMVAALRKGEVWIVDKAYGDPKEATFKRIANALHEPLGLLVDGDDLLTTQRSEVTRLRDTNGDDIIDEYLAEAKGWGVSGNYHEYAFGPERDGQGRLWISLNQTMGPLIVKDNTWRGWGGTIENGKFVPRAVGMRSPCGLGANAQGDMFYSDQQGQFNATGTLHHLRDGVFFGLTDSLPDTKRPDSPIPDPGEITANVPMAEALEKNPLLKPPAVWFPYRKMGMSATDIVCDQTGGKFGPFENQLFVGDFTMALINRVYLEKVDGEYQGACFPFRKGLQSAVVRLCFGKDGSLFAGETNRGWNSTGRTSYGLERLVWSGKTPFEINTMQALPDGFRLTFTQPVDPKTAQDPKSYTLSSYTYTYHRNYGSEEIDTAPHKITNIQVSDDNLSVTLKVDNLRATYVHELHAPGLRNQDGKALLHPEAYYTLNKIPKN